MGQAARTTKLLLDLSAREQGGANAGKREHLAATVEILNAARRFYLDFFLAHPDKLTERVTIISKKTGEVREGVIAAENLLTWAEFQTVATREHPDPLPNWNFSHAFPDFPNRYRRSVIKDVIGKARGYLTTLVKWQTSGKKKGQPGVPTAPNHPTLYAGTFSLELDELDLRKSFIRLKVYDGTAWVWVHYPTLYNRYFEQRRADDTWEMESPKLILSKKQSAIHFLQTKTITAKKIVESKQDPDLVTVAVDLNVKYLAVLTVRQHGVIKETRFVSDQGLDQHRYRHLKRVAKKQWQSGTPVKGESSNQQIWTHVRRQNLDTAHKAARAIVEVCERYPGCVLVFERLRTIRASGGEQVEETQPQTSQSSERQNQPAGERKSLCHWSGQRGSQSSWHVAVLCSLWQQRREVHVSSWATTQRQRGQTLFLFLLPLRVSCRLQRERQCASQLLSRVSLAAASQEERLRTALSGYRSDGRRPWEGNPDDPAYARMQMSISRESGGATVGPMGARSNPHALSDSISNYNTPECGGNAGVLDGLRAAETAFVHLCPQIWATVDTTCTLEAPGLNMVPLGVEVLKDEIATETVMSETQEQWYNRQAIEQLAQHIPFERDAASKSEQIEFLRELVLRHGREIDPDLFGFEARQELIRLGLWSRIGPEQPQ